ncbi:DinB family protein [Micromonospora sp. A3M-1-15]|uniref:DinB family protein n=1 Tax=Micromonospora sp. A3M-1-15 TaxID=2962035 RepID=UPI0020B759F5|nr:DinB family protein [Micromonospora sp. A3M-1-15]MCP3786942.1 DinB family protein [Micromonospora sp. A3M-1-15]
MRVPFPEPGPSSDVPALFLTYLDYYRDTVADRVAGLTDAQARTARVPSGWTPVELVKHLAFMERRWLVWGFLGEPVPDPWGDEVADRWHVAADETVADLVAALRRGGRRTREIVEATPQATPAALGGRFIDPARRPTLAAILFHVLQEYARHAGHLDIVRELADGRTGE